MLGRARYLKSRWTGVSHDALRWFPRHRRLLLGLSAAGIAAALVSTLPAASSAASKTTSLAIPAAAAQRLSGIAEGVAAMDGDAKPAWIEAVATNRDKALRIATPGDTVPGTADQTVYLVVINGNFTLNSVPTPPRAHAPTGHYLALTFDPGTFQVMDLGLTNRPPPAPLRSLGQVSMLAQQK
jgi:hypothetical protein